MGEEKIDFSMFINDYLNDAGDGLRRANNALLAMRDEGADTAILGEAARALHTLKSSSAMLGFYDIADLAYFSENILWQMTRGETPAARETIDALMEVISTLEEMVRQRGKMEEPSAELGMRIAELMKKMKAPGKTADRRQE